MNKPKPQNRATNRRDSLLASDNPLQEIYDRPITKVEEEEMMFNLVNFLETLITMDRQHQEWQKKNKHD